MKSLTNYFNVNFCQIFSNDDKKRICKIPIGYNYKKVSQTNRLYHTIYCITVTALYLADLYIYQEHHCTYGGLRGRVG